MNKENLKRYLVSSLVTFLSAFLFTFALLVKDMSVESMTVSAFVAAGTTALRFGVKALAELIVVLLSEPKK